jgi:glycosyltransferase involved in cell wall biosynthesis
MNPRVSVVIPTKNRPHYVSLAIQSVLSQTFQDLEIIVVDASTKSTKDVTREFDDDRIHYIRQADLGVSVSRNTGIKHARGQFIAFLDDDDLWMPLKLQKQLELMNKDCNTGVVYCAVRIINKDGKTIGFRSPSLKGNIFPEILEKNYVGGCSRILVRKSCLDKVDMFDENLMACEDFDLWIRLAKHCRFDYVNEPLVSYRIHKERMSEDTSRLLKSIELLYKKHSKELTNLPEYKKIRGFWHNSLGVLYCECGNTRRARKEFVEAIRDDPVCIFCFARLLTSFLGSTVFSLLFRFLDYLLPLSFKTKIG